MSLLSDRWLKNIIVPLWLSFYPLNSIFCTVEILNFDEVWFTNFFFCRSGFWCKVYGPFTLPYFLRSLLAFFSCFSYTEFTKRFVIFNLRDSKQDSTVRNFIFLANNSKNTYNQRRKNARFRKTKADCAAVEAYWWCFCRKAVWGHLCLSGWMPFAKSRMVPYVT